MSWKPLAILLLAALPVAAQTNSSSMPDQVGAAADAAHKPSQGATNSPSSLDQREAEVREACINGRRAICGKVIKVLLDGLVVDSGYTGLLHPPFGQSWVVSQGALVSRDLNAVESKKPASACIGLVFLTDIPKRPAVKQYDYVVIEGYPAGQYIYAPLPDVQRRIRRFAAGLETAIRLTLASAGK